MSSLLWLSSFSSSSGGGSTSCRDASGEDSYAGRVPSAVSAGTGLPERGASLGADSVATSSPFDSSAGRPFFLGGWASLGVDSRLEPVFPTSSPFDSSSFRSESESEERSFRFGREGALSVLGIGARAREREPLYVRSAISPSHPAVSVGYRSRLQSPNPSGERESGSHDCRRELNAS